MASIKDEKDYEPKMNKAIDKVAATVSPCNAGSGMKEGIPMSPHSSPIQLKKEPDDEPSNSSTMIANRHKEKDKNSTPYHGLQSARKRQFVANDASIIDSPYASNLSAAVKKEESTTTGMADNEDGHVPSANPAKKQKTGDRAFAPPKRTIGKKATHENARQIDTRTADEKSAGWYETVNMNERYARGDLQTLKSAITLIENCEKAAKNGTNMENCLSLLRQKIHEMDFFNFLSGVLVKKSKLLEDKGLPRVFEVTDSMYPWDIIADSRSLYQKWLNGFLDPHLFRGITIKKGPNSNGKNVTSKSLEANYTRRVSCNYVGNGALANGQWWPLQICAMRDGAHGEIEGGIHGQTGKGAYSIVIAHGGYANVDLGNSIKYCGTPGSQTGPSLGTKHLLDSFRLDHEIRVLRSAGNSKSAFRPAKGIRYDGLYKITDWEIMHEPTSMHRFGLERCEYQDPIRFEGVERRPTNKELSDYQQHKDYMGLA